MQATLDALAEFPRRLEAHFAAVPPELLRWAPPRWDGIPSERLTPVEQVWHLRDIEIDGYHHRFRRTLHEVHPLLPDLDSDALARDRHYAERDRHGRCGAQVGVGCGGHGLSENVFAERNG